MSDEFKPTKEQAKAGWTERSLEAYVNERNAAAGGNIFGRQSPWFPLTAWPTESSAPDRERSEPASAEGITRVGMGETKMTNTQIGYRTVGGDSAVRIMFDGGREVSVERGSSVVDGVVQVIADEFFASGEGRRDERHVVTITVT